MSKTKRNIEEADRRAAERLSKLWVEFKKKNPGISQDAAGGRVGLSQAVFSQYLLCKIPLGVGATLKFAKLFGVDPSEIRTDFDYQSPRSATTVLAEEPAASLYNNIDPEAMEVARAWQSLPKERQQCFRDMIFIEAVVTAHYPWLRRGVPANQTYGQFEKNAAKSFSKLKKKQETIV